MTPSMTDTCPTWPTLLAWLENDLPDEEGERIFSRPSNTRNPPLREATVVVLRLALSANPYFCRNVSAGSPAAYQCIRPRVPRPREGRWWCAESRVSGDGVASSVHCETGPVRVPSGTPLCFASFNQPQLSPVFAATIRS